MGILRYVEPEEITDTDALIALINAEKGARSWSTKRLSEESGIPLGTLNRRLGNEPRSIKMAETAKLAAAFNMATSEFIAAAEDRRLKMQAEANEKAARG